MSSETAACDFCEKSLREVQYMIASQRSPTSYVCDECVELCVDILVDTSRGNVWRRVAFAAARQKVRELFGART